MTGRNRFRDLTRGFTPVGRPRVKARKEGLRAAMPLHELRRARALLRQAIGEALQVQQPAAAKLERRADMHVSDLRSYVEVLGGKLSVVAEVPQGKVATTNFADPAADIPSD